MVRKKTKEKKKISLKSAHTRPKPTNSRSEHQGAQGCNVRLFKSVFWSQSGTTDGLRVKKIRNSGEYQNDLRTQESIEKMRSKVALVEKTQKCLKKKEANNFGMFDTFSTPPNGKNTRTINMDR